MKILSLILLALFIGAPQCFAEEEETPEAGLKVILKLYQEKKFETLIKERYTEIHKAEEAGQVDKLVQQFSNRFSNEKKLNQVIEVFESLTKVKPVVAVNPMPQKTETEKIATFPLGNGKFTLYLQKNGKWGFHL